ncbi:hypothetical protein LEM8419_00929 [Neolewinella maritima]|uniref:PEGA domain-containing protein n=1 Tax=Neolewinella maritima TaxID=1383882 RepID=A0ABN8F6H9_9BACT|nr:PEGA domain-containing protein [Neolewinella maritima]CAH0999629.1 hypothetical protein LEM8419_00929 [Neolewinella maritima]
MFKYLPFLLVVFVSSSCATVFTGTADDIYFTSQPSGAMVYLEGHPLGRTPLITKVPRRTRSRYVTFELEGHQPVSQLMTTRLNAVTLVNLLWWPGFIVDAVIGALVKPEYDRYYSELYAYPPAEE